jgi:hypothetical protein
MKFERKLSEGKESGTKKSMWEERKGRKRKEKKKFCDR